MDLFGLLVLAFVTAVFGGITRDVLIGAVPPASIASWHSPALAVAAGLLNLSLLPAVRPVLSDFAPNGRPSVISVVSVVLKQPFVTV